MFTVYVSTADLAETSKLLEVERSRAERLQNSLQQAEVQSRDYLARVENLSTKERELTDKTRDQASIFPSEH